MFYNKNKMRLLIVLTCIFIILFIIKIVFKKEKFLLTGIKPVIYNFPVIIRPVNVPLSALTSPYKKVSITLNPYDYNFAIYRSQFLTPVKDQGEDCGCCWAFATCGIIADRLSIFTNGRVNKSLSVQQLLSCIYNGKRNGCDGGNPEEAFEWISKSGFYLSPEEKNTLLDYQQIPSRTKTPSVITTACSMTNYGVKIKPNSTLSIVKFIENENIQKNDLNYSTLLENIYNMKAELLNGGPFYCAMTVYEDFYYYDGLSVYTHNKSSNKVGGHAIEIIGYCDKGIDTRTGFSDPYWLCKNSWGSNWPIKSKDKGYFAIKMGENECGIESRCGLADPLIELNINIFRSRMMYTNYNSFKNNLIGSFTTKNIIQDNI